MVHAVHPSHGHISNVQYPWGDSNSHNLVSETSMYTKFHHTGKYQSQARRQSKPLPEQRLSKGGQAWCTLCTHHTDIYQMCNTRGEIRTPTTLCLRQVCIPNSITRANIKVKPAVNRSLCLNKGFPKADKRGARCAPITRTYIKCAIPVGRFELPQPCV